MVKMRLHKFLANMEIASRRKSESLIVAGRISVNGKIIKKLGTIIDSDKDVIRIDNKIISNIISKKYLLLNKPKGFLCTKSDPFGRPTIYNLLKDIKDRLNYAGRLDFDSEGLVLLTNDGELINHITHPKKEIKKVYIVKINGIINERDLKKLENGIPITTILTTKKCQVKLLKQNKKNSLLKITITEGKKRQIRKMLAYLGFQVQQLKRIQIAILKIDDLKTGQYRFLDKIEVIKLKKYLGITI